MPAPFQLPTTDTEWQDAVDCADGAIHFDAARKYGLIRGGPEINLERAEALLSLGAERGFHPRADAPEAFTLSLLELQLGGGRCQLCGCTENDCRECIEKTGAPCSWANEERTLCTACVSGSLQLAIKQL